jgi:hypothetical protein
MSPFHPYQSSSRSPRIQVRSVSSGNTTLRPSFNMVSQEFTRSCWNPKRPPEVWFDQRQPNEVPPQFRKATTYGYSQVTNTTSYHTISTVDRREVPIEFCTPLFLWVEVCWFEKGTSWEGYRPAADNLECNIPLNELTQEERHQLDNPGPVSASQTPSPSPSTHRNITEDIRASTPSQHGVQLAVIAESLQL